MARALMVSWFLINLSAWVVILWRLVFTGSVFIFSVYVAAFYYSYDSLDVLLPVLVGYI